LFSVNLHFPRVDDRVDHALVGAVALVVTADGEHVHPGERGVDQRDLAPLHDIAVVRLEVQEQLAAVQVALLDLPALQHLHVALELRLVRQRVEAQEEGAEIGEGERVPLAGKEPADLDEAGRVVRHGEDVVQGGLGRAVERHRPRERLELLLRLGRLVARLQQLVLVVDGPVGGDADERAVRRALHVVVPGRAAGPEHQREREGGRDGDDHPLRAPRRARTHTPKATCAAVVPNPARLSAAEPPGGECAPCRGAC
jgi:hypothetical protein